MCFAGRNPSVDCHICAPYSRVNTLRNCLSKCGPSYGEKTPLGASIDHKDSSGRSHGHIVTVSVRRVASRKPATKIPRSKPFFCSSPFLARCPLRPRNPRPRAGHAKVLTAQKAPSPPPPYMYPQVRARAKRFRKVSVVSVRSARKHSLAAARWAPQSTGSTRLAPTSRFQVLLLVRGKNKRT